MTPKKTINIIVIINLKKGIFGRICKKKKMQKSTKKFVSYFV